ncbi:hypothetical protein U1Q18_013480, partial [Sarracenia purpurea var. burkii]
TTAPPHWIKTQGKPIPNPKKTLRWYYDTCAPEDCLASEDCLALAGFLCKSSQKIACNFQRKYPNAAASSLPANTPHAHRRGGRWCRHRSTTKRLQLQWLPSITSVISPLRLQLISRRVAPVAGGGDGEDRRGLAGLDGFLRSPLRLLL